MISGVFLLYQALLTAGSRVHMDAEDRRGLTLLHRAVLNNCPKIVRLFIEHGVHLETGHTQIGDPTEIQEYNEEYPTPALLASAFGRSECMKAILEGPPGDVELVLEKPGRLDIVAVVVERMQGNAVPETAETPVAWATQYPSKFVAKSVKVMGIGPQVEFMSSCKFMEPGHVECVDLLLQAGSGITSDQLQILEDNVRRLRQEGCSGQALTSIRQTLDSGLLQCTRCGLLGFWKSIQEKGEVFCSDRCKTVHARMSAPVASVTVGGS